MPAPPDARESSLAYIRRIVEYCRREGIDLRVFVTPSHVHQLEIAAAVGAWRTVEEGKRALVRLLAEDARRHRGRPPIPLFDFSGYSSVTTEPLPPRGSRVEMRYYWDSSHFKEQVGDYVLDRMFGVRTAEREVPGDFGVQLDEDRIEPLIGEQRAAQLAYRQRYPEEVAALRRMVRAKTNNGGGPMISASLATY